MAEYAKTIDELAEKFKTSRQTIAEWKRNKDFPQPTKRGLWNVGKIDEWCKQHGRGPYRRVVPAAGDGAVGAGTKEGTSQHEANCRKTIYQAENERIKAEIAAIEQAKLFDQILDVEDVRSICAQMVATVIACVGGFETAVDREIPGDIKQKPRIMQLVRKLHADMSAAMDNLW